MYSCISIDITLFNVKIFSIVSISNSNSLFYHKRFMKIFVA